MNKEEARSTVIGAISMALKDPTLQQGFEIICKNLAELEKENAEWKQRNETLKDALEHARKLYGDELEKAYKENAELESQVEKMKCGGNCKHLYHVNTGGCYDAKCDLTYCDCTNCKDEWELRR